MLNLYNVTIEIQSFSSIWAVFLVGPKEDIEQRFWSFWNWKGISGNSCEPDWWSDNCIVFWTYPTNFRNAMEQMALQEILNSNRVTKGSNPMPEARQIASQRIELIDRVQLIKYADAVRMGYEDEEPKETPEEKPEVVTSS
jgi:hypothetical protein